MTANKLSLESRKAAYRRRYKRTVKELLMMLQSEIEALDDETFEPSTAIESTLLHVIQEGNRLKALLEIEEF
jgi:hypothetical protein